MRVNLATNVMSCQPLRNFGNAEKPQPKAPSNTNNPAFSSATVSKEEYDKLNAKYDFLARITVAQVDQYNQLAAKYKALASTK